jgi:protein SCO1
VRPTRSPLNQIIGATFLLLVAGVIFFPAYLYWNGSIQRSVAVLPKCGDAPRFESRDQAGRSIGTAEPSGTIWLGDFLDTAKPADAELFNSKFAELDQNLHGTKEVTLVSFCLGAEKKALEDYAQRYEASDRWRFVSIPEPDSSTFLESWSLATAACRGKLRPQDVFVLVDRQGVIRGVYDAAEREVVQKILTDAGNLLRAEKIAP